MIGVYELNDIDKINRVTNTKLIIFIYLYYFGVICNIHLVLVLIIFILCQNKMIFYP